MKRFFLGFRSCLLPTTSSMHRIGECGCCPASITRSHHLKLSESDTQRIKPEGAEERILWICGGHPSWCSVQQLQRTTENTSRAMPIPSMDRGLPEPLQTIAVVRAVKFEAATSQVIQHNYHTFVSRFFVERKEVTTKCNNCNCDTAHRAHFV